MSGEAAVVAGRFIGASVLRREDPRLLAGRGSFVDDVTVPGLLHVAFFRSDIARGNVLRLDVSQAHHVPGVRAVLTAEDLNPIVGPMGPTLFPKEMPHAPVRPLAAGDVRFVGESPNSASQGIQWADRHLYTTHRTPHEHAVSAPVLLQLRQCDVADRQRLGHPVRRVRLAVPQKLRCCSQRFASNRCTSGQQQTYPRATFTLCGVE